MTNCRFSNCVEVSRSYFIDRERIHKSNHLTYSKNFLYCSGYKIIEEGEDSWMNKLHSLELILEQGIFIMKNFKVIKETGRILAHMKNFNGLIVLFGRM